MPENPNVDPESGSEYFYGNTMAAANNNNNNNRKQQVAPRVSSAGMKYYDIATQLLGKAGSDLEELFIAAARDGVYERIENFLHRNRSEYVLSIDVKDKKTGNTPLIWAAKRGHAKIVQLLLRHGADITLRNYEGQTAVEVASPSIRSILLESVERGTEASHQLLLQAAWQGDIKVVTRLISQKKVLDINCQNADGFTPVMLATRDMILFERLSTQMSRPYNPVEVVSELLSARADLHAVDGDGKTCLHHAAQSKAIIAQSVVSTIISGGPNLECKDKRCFTPIHCASLTGNADCITTLLDGGSEVNSRGFAGATPLHITSYNNHERATEVLLEYGGNVTLTDDRGMTAMDFAKTRKMKKKLQEAWAEVVNNKTSTSLGPIRAPSREDLRTSIEDLTKRRKGEVIFDGMPSNPFADASKKEAIAKTSSVRRSSSLRDLGSLRVDTLLDSWFPINLDTFLRKNKGNKGITRHLSLKEKSGKGEEDFNGTYPSPHVKLGQVRNQKPSPLPRAKSRSTERLPAISPDRMSDRNLESPIHFSRSNRSRRSFEDKKQAMTNRSRRVTPLTTREGSTLTDEYFDRLTPGPPSPTPSVRHKRSESDPNRSTPNLLDIAASCEPYLQPGTRRGRSCSVTSNPANNISPDSNKHTPIPREGTVTSMQREITLMSICSYRTDSRMSTNSTSPRLLNLGQMLCKSKTPVQNVALYGPGSNKVIPPTPTFLTQTQRCGSKSGSDTSPRSDEEMSEVFRDNLENPAELLRSRTIFKEEFILEESRPKDPFFQSSSGSDTVSSSESGHFSSPRDTPLSSRHGKLNSLNAQNVQGKPTKNSSAKNIVTSMSITKPKINEKSVTTAKRNSSCSGSKVLNGTSSGQNTKGDKLVQNSKGGINGANVNGNTKDMTALHTTAVGNAAVDNASKTKVSANKNDAKIGGETVQGHKELNVLKTVNASKEKTAMKEVKTSESDTSKTSKNVQVDNSVSDKQESKNVKNGGKFDTVTPNISGKTINSTAVAKENKPKTPSTTRKTASNKQINSVLQVVPTKLTENVIQSVAQVSKGKDEKHSNSAGKTATDIASDKNIVKSERVDKSNTSENGQVKNVKMQLSPSAQVINRVTNQISHVSEKPGEEKVNNITKTDTQSKPVPTTSVPCNNKTESKSAVANKPSPQSANGPVTQSVNKQHNQPQSVTNTMTQNSNKSLNQSNSNRTVNQSNSAQVNNRQGAQSRNAISNINVSRSAGAVQRQTKNVKKPLSSYTPRFQSFSTKKSNNSNLDTNEKSNPKLSSNTSTGTGSTTIGSASDNISSLNQSNSGTKQQININTNKTGNLSSTTETKPVGSISPTELVGPSVCRSGSMSKSYNMASVPTGSKASSTSSVSSSSDNSATTKTSGVSDPNKTGQNTKTVESRKTSILSKSTSDSVSGSAKMSSASILSKSVSQMPSVGSVIDDKSHKMLLRSSSMSTIEESKEKQRMSSSDTKVECKKSTKERPLSDGPVGATSGHGNNSPLVEIIPDCAPRMSKISYMEANAKHTTPVIVNPFEELEQKREEENKLKLDRAVTATEFGFVVEKPVAERSKTQTSLKSRNVKSAKKTSTTKDAKPSSANIRGSSAKRKRPRTKDQNKSESENTRPKSGKTGKRVRSGRRKKKTADNELSKQNEQPDVALIGGIGWQLATSCLDKSDVDAVKVSQIDSSESETEDVDIVTVTDPLHLDIPPSIHLHIPNSVETPSSLSSPRFREVRPQFQNKPDLPYMDNDGFPPMNLDMTQNSNRSGVIINQNIPGDISDFLAQLKEEDISEFDDIEDDSSGEDYDTEDDSEAYTESSDTALNQQFIMGKLTPIPESPALTSTSASLKHVARTVNAINKFDENIKDEDLSKLLGVTPRDKHSSFRDNSSLNVDKSSSGSVCTKINSLRNSGGSLRSSPSQINSKSQKSVSSSANSRSQISRGASSKTNSSMRSSSGDVKDRNSLPQKQQNSSHPKTAEGSSKNNSARKSGIYEEIKSRYDKVSEKYEVNKQSDMVEKAEHNKRVKKSDATAAEPKGNNSKNKDLKQLLTEKMQSTQKMLEEQASHNSKSASAKRRTSANADKVTVKNLESSTKRELEINVRDLENESIVINLEASNRGSDAGITDDDVKSTRSSRRERRFSETKNHIPDRDDDISEAIDEILSNTFPSSRRSGNSFRSANSTLTEADKKVLRKMSEDNKESPFHAKGGVRASSSYDESVTLNRDNPELMRRFHAEKFHMGQKVKAMIEAGADTARVKAMVISDNESKQLARIMNSFRQMELYAGPHNTNRSSKKETPRRDGEFKSLSKFENHSHQTGALSGRPGSAGAGRVRTGKFTEIKGKSLSAQQDARPHSPSAVPKNLAEEFKRSPYVQVGSHRDSEHFEDMANAMRPDSPDNDTLTEHFSLVDDGNERADSACTSLSSHSSIMEETIQWKKGNVLGKGAFGTVWCGLTSEGQLIAVKQIELNTNNKHKAKKEYEKVQEEVELLKTLEHKNIVGYFGTSLEDSVVSIFMQFVPGGSIASILARFGALDEAVFRKYTRQILEGVEYLHHNDVIHRDIKGGNVMLMPNGVIKLIDFGCAKRLCINLSMGQSEILKSMKGTPYWMAPEVVNETGHGKKSDIWSVGCTVFEMATRKPPWADMNPMAAIFAIGSDKPVPQLPDRFTDEARDFVNSCLCRDQLKRLSATELLQTTFIKRRGKKSSTYTVV